MKCLTSGQHRIQQQDPPVRNVLWKLVIVQLRLRRLLVPLNKNLPDPHRSTTIPQTLLHRLTSPHNGHAADLALKLDADIVPADRGADLVADDGQVVQALLDKQTNDAIGIEDEVCAACVLVSDHPSMGGE